MTSIHLVPVSVRPPTEDEANTIAGGIEGLRQMFSDLLGSSRLTPAAMDAVFSPWVAGFDPTEEDPAEVQELLVAFGVAFGNCLARFVATNHRVAKVVTSDGDATRLLTDGQCGSFYNRECITR